MQRSSKPPRTVYLRDIELVPVIDPVQLAILERVFKRGKVTAKERKILEEGRKIAEKEYFKKKQRRKKK